MYDTIQWVELWAVRIGAWERIHRRCIHREYFADGTHIEEYMAKDGHSVWRLVDTVKLCTISWLWMPEIDLADIT